MASAPSSPIYRRILVKLSGEALKGEDRESTFSPQFIRHVLDEVKAVLALGVQVALVVGGGNLFRGREGEGLSLRQAPADSMGMLATVMNGLLLKEIMSHEGIPVSLYSSLAMPEVCAVYRRSCVQDDLAQGRVCLLVAGLGLPFFTTDTAAVLRARELECDVMMKATRYPGIYDADPAKDAHAKHQPRLSYDDVMGDCAGGMDATAVTLAAESKLPLVVFSIFTKGGLIEAVQGQGTYTHIQ